MIWVVCGGVAAVLTASAFVPQIVKSIKLRSVRDVSLLTIVQFLLGVFLWLAYGLYRRDIIIIAANAFTAVSLLILLFLHARYEGRKP
jgi:MtN3 and saliva related transmembrane protein